MSSDLVPLHRGEFTLSFSEETLQEQRRLFVRFKPLLDFVLALVLLAVLWPLILALALLVKATSRGPAFYTQVRLGYKGMHYTIFKLRTMANNCERETGPKWATDGDPRVTRLGRLLRHWHLDELPQLINVIRGEMSLVGPRPERPEIVRELERVIPDYRVRLQMRPGVTGLAQIQLPADVDVSGVHHKLCYDLYYRRRIGPSMDFRILIGTGLKLLGVPFDRIRRLLNLPAEAEVLGRVSAAEPVQGPPRTFPSAP